MKIKEFTIDNLYGKYSFHSTLDEKVNIVVGNNGTFKSTVLDIIRFHASYNGLATTDFESASVSFDNGIVVSSKMTEFILKKDESQVILPIRDITVNGKEMTTEEYTKTVKLDFISTFDIKDKDANTRQTLLDKRLVDLQSKYGYYLNGLQKKFTSHLKKNGVVTQEQYDEVYARKALFDNLINDAFKETGKVINNETEILSFVMDGSTLIDADKLSSGEKQLLIILLTALLEDGREYVLMMDEPEISLHISWQYELLNWILELNPNVQLILTTHSPSIFSDGWGDKAIYMEDITTKSNERHL
jgi:predicted ATP-dependent endonuclease of OLD family